MAPARQPARSLSQNHAAKLEGIYSRRQPTSPQYVLKQRHDQREGLKGSATIVLGGAPTFSSRPETPSGCTGSGGTGSRPTTSDFEAKLNELSPIGGREWAKLATTPKHLDDIPPRLDSCQQRLMSVDRELERCQKLAAASPLLVRNATMEQSAGLSRSLTSPQLNRSGREKMEKLTPLDASLSPSGRSPSQSRTKGLKFDLTGFDPELGVTATADEDLPNQFSAVENGLKDMDRKWRRLNREYAEDKEGWASRQETYERRLREGEERERDMNSQIESLTSNLADSRAEAQQLRADLSVSEEEAQKLRERVAELEQREALLLGQNKILSGKLFEAEASGETLQTSLREAALNRDLLQEKLAEAEHTHEAHRVASEQREAVLQGQAKVVHAQLHEAQTTSEGRRGDLEKAAQGREVLAGKLAAAEEAHASSQAEAEQRHAVLNAQAKTLYWRIYEAEAESEGLRENLDQATQGNEMLTERLAGAEAEHLAYRSEAERRETVLNEGAKAMQSELHEVRAKGSELQGNLEAAVLNQERLASRVAEVEREHEAHKAEAKQREEQLQGTLHSAHLEHQALQDKLAEVKRDADSKDAKAKDVEGRLLAAEERAGSAERRTRAQIAEMQAAQAAGRASTPSDIAEAAPDDDAELLAQMEALQAMVGPNLASIPELIFCSERMGSGGAGAWEKQPTRMQLDTVLGELSLWPLQPMEPQPRKVALSQVTDINQPFHDMLPGNVVEIELMEEVSAGSRGGSRAAAVHKTLQFTLADEQQAGALVAALAMKERVAPGSDLITPASSARSGPGGAPAHGS